MLFLLQVRKVCGRAEMQSSTEVFGNESSNDRHAAASATGGSQATQSRALPAQLHAQLGNFLASVVRSRTFYGTLADAICEEYPDTSCWNGLRVAE